MSAKWSESTVLRFFELYQRHDCLWNHKLDNYRNRDARDNALTAIVQDMNVEGITVTDIKNKIKTIRTMYKKELTMVLKSKKSGTGTDEIYTPKLFWFKKADTFLRDVSVTRESTSNLELPANELEQNETTNEFLSNTSTIDTEIDMGEASILNSTEVTPRVTPSTSVHTGPTPFKSPGRAATPQHKKLRSQIGGPPTRKRKSNETNITNIHAAIDKLGEVTQQNTNDEFDAFGKLVAMQLKQLPLYNGITCQEKIMSIIRQERLQLLLQSSSNSPSPTSTQHSNFSIDGWSAQSRNNSQYSEPSYYSERQCYSQPRSSEAPAESQSSEYSASDILSQALSDL